MKPEVLCSIAAVVSVIALILSAVALYESLDNNNDKDDDQSKEYTLFFGMDPGTSEADKEKLKSYAVSIATKGGYGYTCYWAEGGYTAADGKVVQGQQTLVFIMAHTTGDFVEDLAEKVKKEFGLDTVMIETSEKHIEFE